MQEKFAMAIYIEPGVLQLCDAFSLKPFVAMKMPINFFSYMDYTKFNNNQLIGLNNRQLLLIELDHELKRDEDTSIF